MTGKLILKSLPPREELMLPAIKQALLKRIRRVGDRQADGYSADDSGPALRSIFSDPEHSLDEVLSALTDLVRAGTVRIDSIRPDAFRRELIALGGALAAENIPQSKGRNMTHRPSYSVTRDQRDTIKENMSAAM